MRIMFFVLLVSVILGYRKPILGIALFLLFTTGATGFFEQVGLIRPEGGPFQPGAVACAAAVLSLALRRPRQETLRHQHGAIELLFWAFTVLALVAVLADIGTVYPMKTLGEIFVCMLWAPLFMAFDRMSPQEHAQSRQLVIGASALTAFLTVFTVATENPYLYHTLSIYRNIDVPEPIMFATGRITLPGMWTVLPFGIWLCIRELLVQHKRPWLAKVCYGGSAAIMCAAIALNLTRSILLGFACGLAVALLAGGLTLPRPARLRLAMLGILSVAMVFLAAQSFEGLTDTWMLRFSTEGRSTMAADRMDRNHYMLDILMRKVPLVGRMDPTFFDPEGGTGGDPQMMVWLWWQYGLLAALAYGLLLIATLVGLLRLVAFRRRYPQAAVLDATVLLSFWVQLQWQMGSGYYLFPEAVFPLTMFFAQTAALMRAPVERQAGVPRCSPERLYARKQA